MSSKKKTILYDNKFSSLNTSRSYWTKIACNLEMWCEHLEKEIKEIEKILPNSYSYWTMNSELQDSKTVAKVVRDHVDGNI